MQVIDDFDAAVHDGDVGIVRGDTFVALADLTKVKNSMDDELAARLPNNE